MNCFMNCVLAIEKNCDVANIFIMFSCRCNRTGDVT